MNENGLFLVAIPKQGVNTPPLALTYLQGVCKHNDIDVEVRDFNLELWEDTIHTKWWEIWKESNESLYKGEVFFQFMDEFYGRYVDEWAKIIAEHPAKFVGISCFSYRSLPTLKYLTPKIREYNPDKVIIVGGAPILTYKDWIINEGLADYAVASEGEVALVEIIKGKQKPGTVIPPQINDLDSLPLPDYSGLDIERYIPGDPGGLVVRDPKWKRDRYEVGIMGSRGCVRKCTFCDVESFWPKYRWRSAESIYSEMEYHLDEGIEDIYFFDSLVNGNQKEFERLLDIIIENGSQFHSIKGLGIIKKQPERIYQKMAKANFNQLMVGIESFSEKMRADMNKKFDNKLLRENLEMFRKYNIRVILLLIVGYPSQTEKDHYDEYLWMKEHAEFVGNPIKRIEIGGTMLILPGAPVFRDAMFDMKIDENGDWVTFPNGETNNMEVRIRRREEIIKWAEEFGYVTEGTYKEGGLIIGDPEKGTVADYQRPQDNLTSIYEINHERDSADEKEMKQFIGWESDPNRISHKMS